MRTSCCGEMASSIISLISCWNKWATMLLTTRDKTFRKNFPTLPLSFSISRSFQSDDWDDDDDDDDDPLSFIKHQYKTKRVEKKKSKLPVQFRLQVVHIDILMSGKERIPSTSTSDGVGNKRTRSGITYDGKDVQKKTRKRKEVNKLEEEAKPDHPPTTVLSVDTHEVEEQFATNNSITTSCLSTHSTAQGGVVDRYAYESPTETLERLRRENQEWIRLHPASGTEIPIDSEIRETETFFSTVTTPELEANQFGGSENIQHPQIMDADEIAELIKQEVARALEAAARQQHDPIIFERILDAVQTQNEAILSQGASNAEAITNTLKNVQLSSVSSHIDPPKFDVKKMSVKGFLGQAENYFKSMRYDNSLYLTAVRQILPSEIKLWYDHEISEGFSTWKEFKKAFKEKYDGWYERETRMRTLNLKKQQRSGPTERFIYEVIELSRYCYPDEDEADHVRRAQGALYPHLAVAVGLGVHNTARDLIRACEIASSMVQAQDAICKRECSVPPMRGGERNENNSLNKNGKPNSNNGNNGNTQFQQRGENRGGFSNRSQGRGRFNSRGSYNAATGGNREPPESNPRGGNNSSRGPSRGGRTAYKNIQRSNRETEKDDSTVKCMKCQGYGHKIKDCPTKREISMVLLEDGTEVPIVEESLDDKPTEPLNE
ncbi:unnamed protein product [Orchesella dallaii]|uniref:CCHC-type domain-containing protein n=1 Tax=Orchesella dallaii TaxID=48710 RepID=A0ABP1RC74_9HEXA